MQDTYTAPVEPTPTMTFSFYGVRTFQVQYWTGSTWAPCRAGRSRTTTSSGVGSTFAPLTTSKIRVYIRTRWNDYSRVMEVEAWGVAAGRQRAAGRVDHEPGRRRVVDGAGDDHDQCHGRATATARSTSVDVLRERLVASGQTLALRTARRGATSRRARYTLTAVATDNDGATTTSDRRARDRRRPTSPPNVSITSPPKARRSRRPRRLLVTTAASDSDGTVASVAFYANGALDRHRHDESVHRDVGQRRRRHATR